MAGPARNRTFPSAAALLPPPTTVKAGLTGTALATTSVPPQKRKSSNTPIHRTVPEHRPCPRDHTSEGGRSPQADVAAGPASGHVGADVAMSPVGVLPTPNVPPGAERTLVHGHDDVRSGAQEALARRHLVRLE